MLRAIPGPAAHMRTSYASTPKRAASSGSGGLRVARLVVVLYFCACALHGFVRLRAGGGGVEASMAVLHLWYLEALLFLSLWGAVALIAGVVGGGRMTTRGRKAVGIDTRGSGLLAALERDRGR